MAKASKKFKPVSESELKTLVQKYSTSSAEYYSSKLSEERKKVMEYYHGEKPAPSHAGNSKYVSMDVFDAVESLKAVLLETFSAGNKIVSFDPQSDADVEPMRVATEYADYVVFRQNDAYGIFSSIIQDGLMARTGIAKVWWDECYEEQEEEFSDIDVDSLEMLSSQEDIENVDAEHDPETGLFSGTLTRKIDKSQVRYVPVAPEEFLITSTAPSIHEAHFVAHKTRKTRSELISMGYDKDLVYGIGNSDDDEVSMSPERLARFEDIGTGMVNLEEDQDSEQTEHVIVTEAYMPIDMDGSGVAKLWKITMGGTDTILDKEQVDRKPFICFTPLPLPHAFYGGNYAARVIPTQNARTVLVRGILDHTVITNNPRLMVVKGAVQNPKELLENRVGGLVNVSRPDGIIPLQQSGLNPFVFQTIQLLDEDKEEVTGVSRLSQGLNKDAVSKQNSQAMVNDMVSLSQQREKIVARNFANHFIKELYLEVYRLVLLNEKKPKVIRIAGNFVQVDPTEWAEEVTCTVELKLGYNEQQQEAMKYLTIHSTLAADPGNARLYNEQNRYAVFKTALEKTGIKQVNQFLTDPSTLGAPQPDPFKVQEMQLESRKVAVQESVAQTSAKKTDDHAQIEMLKLQLEKMQMQMEQVLRNREVDVKQFTAESNAALHTQELHLVEKEMEQNPPQTQAVIRT
ncbi:hypothetical protein AWB76_07215 [Caballeronia temeraria]|uniref:Portal protein n=1 Tax=Caballeronia temeraria TaxID=1777137 RepID=A0A158DMW5_9BURK|nr:hypothetical protein [Caballeronia temeraria]SAK95905.1 hypothetical protein AWB76_07215 [Caballeronia temeraria]